MKGRNLVEETFLKKYILIGIIVFVNIILILLTAISVIKSINKVAKGETINSKVETASEMQDLNRETQDEQVEDNIQDDDMGNMNFSLSDIFTNFSKIKDYIDMKSIQTCILLVLGVNLAILSFLILRKLKR